MANVIDMTPKFTEDETSGTGTMEAEESSAQAPADETGEKEKETPVAPPATEEPALVEKPSDDTNNLAQAIQALQKSKNELVKEIVELRGQRRNLKQEEIIKVQEKIDELKDVNPDDALLIEKILKAKGYVTREDANKMFYESVKQEELNKFLDKYPEYKPENDPNDINWGTLQRELGFYRMPDNPHQIIQVLERAHRAIGRVVGDTNVAVKKRQAEVAGVGSGGIQRSSPRKTLNPRFVEQYRQGGWSEEEISNIEKNLE